MTEDIVRGLMTLFDRGGNGTPGAPFQTAVETLGLDLRPEQVSALMTTWRLGGREATAELLRSQVADKLAAGFTSPTIYFRIPPTSPRITHQTGGRTYHRGQWYAVSKIEQIVDLLTEPLHDTQLYGPKLFESQAERPEAL